MTTTTGDQDLARTYRAVFGAGVILAAGTMFVLDGRAALGVVLGASMAGLSLVLLAKAVKNLIAGARASWALVAVFKFAFLLILTYWVLQSRLVPPLGLALGIGALPLGIFFSGLMPAPESSGGPSADQEPTRKD
jgi:hypothetical protein